VVFAQADGSNSNAVYWSFLAVPAGVFAVFVLYGLCHSVYLVQQKEFIVVERFGQYQSTLSAGLHILIPYVDRPKKFNVKYHVADSQGHVTVVEKTGLIRISTQTQVMDFPKQMVITRDNGLLFLDCVVNYAIKNPKQMIYSVTNLPHVIERILQAQIRNVAGGLDVDQLIEDSALLHVLTGMLDNEAMRWGVKVNFVKVQKVYAPNFESVLQKKKETDLKNKQVIIDAKAGKQTNMIESEGQRDASISKANGTAQEVLSVARGAAQATINFANAEARSIKEIARALEGDAGNPVHYLLASKYMDALRDIIALANTQVLWVPRETALFQALGAVNTGVTISPRT